MKRIAIITKIDNNNFGNRLQNYALQEVISKYDFEVETLKNVSQLNSLDSIIITILKRIKYIYLKKFFIKKEPRNKKFDDFNKHINFSKKTYDNFNFPRHNSYDKYFIGSDQVWNPKFDVSKLYLAEFNYNENNKYSYAASFGINEIDYSYKKRIIKSLKNFNKISVREDRGKEIIEEVTDIKNVEVLVDPTMLLTPKEWDRVSKRPKQLDNIKNGKYIFNYFLGCLSTERKKEIEKFAIENDCHIINILDKNDPFYASGPSEFLYLEKHAFLICTDSFHSSVFAILYNRPFIIFNREQSGIESMNTRLDTLINKFKVKNRKYNGKYITKENIEHDYTEAYEILEKEREKSKKFLEKALDIRK